MKKKYLLIVVLIILAGVMFTTTKVRESEVCFSNGCVNVEIADSVSERSKGLMFVSSLNEDEGMLFVFEESGRHSFWMKNTLIPLDIIWISEDLEIVEIVSAEPCSEDPCEVHIPERYARYVLEVNSGWTKRNEVRVGNFIELRKY